MPAQERIGELWLDGEWSIAEEHAATAINESLVHWLCSFAEPPAADAPLVVVSCLERERHALPALVVAETAADCRLPGQLRRQRSRAGRPAPPDPHPQAARRAVQRVADLVPGRAEVAARQHPCDRRSRSSVGGRAFGGDDRRALALGATAYARGIDDVLRLMADLPDRPRAGTVAGARPGRRGGGLGARVRRRDRAVRAPGDRAPARARPRVAAVVDGVSRATWTTSWAASPRRW